MKLCWLPLLLATPALACPDLNGAFHECTSTNPEYALEAMEVSQFGSHFNLFATNDGKTVVQDLFADGSIQPQTVMVDGMKVKLDIKASCSDALLTIETQVRQFFLTEVSHLGRQGANLLIENHRNGRPNNTTVCKFRE